HLHVYLCGAEATALELSRGSGLDQWRQALTAPLPLEAGTSLGSALERLMRERYAVSRIVAVTDGYENRAPRLASAFQRYRPETGLRPSLHLVQPAGSALQLAMDLKNAQVPYGSFTVDRHLLGLDALIGALAEQARDDRISQILAYR